MELLQLRYFCFAAENENFSKTAKEFMVPPSNISQSIKRLEKELGKPLFNRTSNSIHLNENGRIFYSHVKKCLDELNLAKNKIIQNNENPKIEILTQIDRRIVMQTAQQYRLLHPETEIIIKHSGSVSDNNFDLIISAEILDEKEFFCQKLFSESIVLAMKKDNPAAKDEVITAENLCKLPFITMNNGSNLYSLTHTVCSEFGFSPRIAIMSDDPFYVRRCVELGLGVAIIPEISWKGQFSDEITFKKITALKRTSYLCQRKGKPISATAETFIDMLINESIKEAEF